MNSTLDKTPVVGKLYKNRGRDFYLVNGTGKLGAGNYVLVLHQEFERGVRTVTFLVPNWGVVSKGTYWDMEAHWDLWWEEVTNEIG